MTTNRPTSSATLLRAARLLRFAETMQGFVRWSALSAGGLLALLLLDELFHLPQALRLPLALVLGGFIAAELYRKVLTPALRPLSSARAARWIETNRGIAGNVLINAYHFEQDKTHASWGKFVAPVLSTSSSVLNEIPPKSLWLTPRLKKWFIGWILLLAAWLVMAVGFPRYASTGIERILLPLADIPPVGNWNIEIQPVGHVTLVEGDKLDLTAKMTSTTGSGGKPPTPIVVWQEGAGISESSANTGEHAAMLPTDKPDVFVFSFSAVSQPFSLRVWSEDSRSASIQVDVIPLPQLKGSTFQIIPPTYTGLKPYSQPGPPATLQVPQGSSVKTTVQLSTDSPAVTWHEEKEVSALTHTDAGWEIMRDIDTSGGYEIYVAMSGQDQPRELLQGQITAVPDHAPEVDFVTQDRNRAVNPGGEIPVAVRATDDYGVASISLQLAPSDDPTNVRVLKTWSYLGPPGQPAPVPENYTVELDPSVFTPGSTFLLTALATDFSPAQQKTTSRPIIVRVAGLQDLAVPQGDALEKLFDLLKNTIALQTDANGLTDNLVLHFSEAVTARDLPKHFGVMTPAQGRAQAAGNAAITEAGLHDESKLYLTKLQSLISGEMGLALGQLGDLPKTAQDQLPTALDSLQKRQAYILNQLIALIGQMASERQKAAELAAQKQAEAPPTVATEAELAKLKDDLKNFLDTQKRVIDATNKLKDINPEDLTTDQQETLGALAREEAKQAEFFQKEVNDLSKLPLQDFSDGKLVTSVNQVYQELQQAENDLYKPPQPGDKRPEYAQAAAPEQAAAETAKEIQHNLERWLGAPPGDLRIAMQEPAPMDAPTPELPKQLDDIIGDLLNKEQQMATDEVSSAITGSMDKEAQGLVTQGPMSDMGGKGSTGNQLPTNNEINGRGGGGRNGRSNGQMVSGSDPGAEGTETPSRMNPSPFENGSVNDTSKINQGQGTGGGKLSGWGQDGLHGVPPPPSLDKLPGIADQQSKLRDQTESLALQLRKQRRPTGDIESAILGMQQVEAAANGKNGLGVVQGYHQVLDSLEAARASYAGTRLSRVEANMLTNDAHKDMDDTQAEETPAGYEEMTGAYFRSLSDSSAGAAPPATTTSN
jgi:hypothetical protein